MAKKTNYQTELRGVEQRTNEYALKLSQELHGKIEKSHMALSSVISNNLSSLKKDIRENTLMIQTHIDSEKLHQERMETLLNTININDLTEIVTMLKQINKADLEGVTMMYRDGQGVRRASLGAVTVISVLSVIGGAVYWTLHKLHL